MQPYPLDHKGSNIRRAQLHQERGEGSPRPQLNNMIHGLNVRRFDMHDARYEDLTQEANNYGQNVGKGAKSANEAGLKVKGTKGSVELLLGELLIDFTSRRCYRRI